MRRGATVVAVLVAWAFAQAIILGPAPPAPQSKIDLVMGWIAPLQAMLDAQPYLLAPVPPGADIGFLMIQSSAANGVEILLDPVTTISGSLTLDRALAEQVRSRPDFWVFVIDSRNGAVLYWIPLDDPRRVRVEAGGKGGVALLDEGVTGVRIPFVPRAIVAVVRTKGGWAIAGPSAIAKLGQSL